MDWMPILTILIPVLVAGVAGAWAYLSGKTKGRIDAQGQINVGFKLLVNQLQEERILFSSDIIALRMELRRAERLSSALARHVHSLEILLVEHSISFVPFHDESNPENPQWFGKK